MADIQTARFGRYLQSLFNLKQRVTLGEVLPDAFPVVDLVKPRPEDELHLGNDLCMGYSSVQAAAAQFAQVGIGFGATPTPQRPGVIVTIEQIWITVGVATEVSFSFGSVAAFNAAATLTKVDTRRFQQAPTAVVRNLSGVAVPTAFWSQTFGTANVSQALKMPIVLCPVPGSFEQAGLIITNATAVGFLRAAFAWRERPVRPDELVV